jgi:hypothetical protein
MDGPDGIGAVSPDLVFTPLFQLARLCNREDIADRGCT